MLGEFRKIARLHSIISVMPTLYIGNKTLDAYIALSSQQVITHRNEYKYIKNVYNDYQQNQMYQILKTENKVCMKHIDALETAIFLVKTKFP